MKIDPKKWLPVAAALALFAALSLAYFSPLLEGKRLIQGDHRTWQGGAQEIVEHRELNNGADPLWTGSMFSGMPAYQISVEWKGNLLRAVDKLFHGFLPHPAGTVFLYLLAMFVLLRVLNVGPWVSVVGAVAYAFSSYFIIIFEAGHNTKATAIGYMPLVVAGVWMLLRGNKWSGAALFALFMGLELGANHLQVTYYLGMVLALFYLAELLAAVREKRFVDIAVRSGLGGVALVLALMANASGLMGTEEYGKYTTRGRSELTKGPDGASVADNQTAGLDKDYVTAWSYGLQESFTLLIPGAKGNDSGSLLKTREDLARITDPALKKYLTDTYQQGGYVNTYWGDQRFTSGPVYLGAVVVLLMLLMLARAERQQFWWAISAVVLIPVLLMLERPGSAAIVMTGYLLAGLIASRNSLVYALFGGFLLTLALSWGRHYMPLTDFFLDHVPGYDKFRAVTIILVIVELAAPVIGILYLDKLVKEGAWDKAAEKRFLIPAGVLALVLAVLAIAPASFFDFLSEAERARFETMADADPSNSDQLVRAADGLKELREGTFSGDAWRSFAFVVIAAGLLFAFGRKMLKPVPLIAGIGLLIIVDLWTVDKRFINNEKDQKAQYLQWEDAHDSEIPYPATAADRSILEQEENPASRAAAAEILEKLKEKKKGESGKGRMVSSGEQMLARFSALRRNSHYRVLDFRDPFNDARTSYYHKSVGGYHGAKLKRYQELIEFHLMPEMGAIRAGLGEGATMQSVNDVLARQDVINMLNTRYLVLDVERPALRNLNAFGPAWFAGGIRWVKDADEEIAALGEVRLDSIVVVDERWRQQLGDAPVTPDPVAEATLTSYATDRLEYTVNSANGGVVVFSEIWYGPDWQAMIDGQPVDHVRADYVLRALRVPAGQHTVVFEVHSRSYELGNKLNLAGSASILLLLAGAAFMRWRSTAKTGE